MPLFFFISGYLLKPTTDYKKYLKRKIIHLLLPYLAFLLLILIPFNLLEAKETIPNAFFRALFGGVYLYKWCGVFWFITTLFLTQQVFNFLVTKLKSKHISMLTALILAYINASYFQRHSFPWGSNIVLYSVPIFYCGYIYKQYSTSNILKNY